MQAVGFDAISIFSGDDASSIVLEKLWDMGVRFISLRSTGYNNIQLKVAPDIGFKVVNAPEYSPHAIAGLAIGRLLALNGKLIVANSKVHNGNFLQKGLLNFDLNGKTVGIVAEALSCLLGTRPQVPDCVPFKHACSVFS